MLYTDPVLPLEKLNCASPSPQTESQSTLRHSTNPTPAAATCFGQPSSLAGPFNASGELIRGIEVKGSPLRCRNLPYTELHERSATRPSLLASFVVNVPRSAPFVRPAATPISTLACPHPPADRVKIKLLTCLMTQRRRFQISALDDHPLQSWHLAGCRSRSYSHPSPRACVC